MDGIPLRRDRLQMDSARAQALALEALAHVAEEPLALARLLAETGLQPDGLRRRLEDPELMGAVLDFVLADERLLLPFCEAQGLKPHLVHRARALLPGGLGEWA